MAAVTPSHAALPAPVLDTIVQDRPLREHLDEIPEFAVPAAVGAALQPTTAAARDLLAADAALGARLVQVADLVRSSPAGHVSHVSLGASVEQLGIARAAARLVAHAEPTPELAGKVATYMTTGANRVVEGEYLPATAHLFLGPRATGSLVQPGAVPPGPDATRAAYVVAHEVAHARQPISAADVADQATRRVEEARADLVARSSGLVDASGAVLGLATSAHELAVDQTYATERAELQQRLAAAGVGLDQQVIAWLDQTPAATLHASLPR